MDCAHLIRVIPARGQGGHGFQPLQHVRFQKEFWGLVEEVRKRDKVDDRVLRQQLASAYSVVEIMRFAGLRTLSEVIAKKEPGPGSSINKMLWSEYHQRFGELAMDVLGMESTVLGL